MTTNTSNKKSISSERKRFNILKHAEFTTISYLCSIMPKWVKPDMLTALGVIGAVVVFAGLQLALVSKAYLLISIFGLAINWFGDSLDGRIAYYRKTPRKWYGWALDIHADWLTIIVIGLGFYFYFPYYNFIAFLFVAAYGGSMIIALLRYKINNKYIIDSSNFGPTELRILLSIVLFLEILFPHVLLSFGVVGTVLLVLFNTIDSIGVLKAGDFRDLEEKRIQAI